MKRTTERERARKTERRHHRAQRRLEAATEVTRSNRAARHTSDGLAGPWLSGTKPGPGAQECVEYSGNELAPSRWSANEGRALAAPPQKAA